MKSVRSDRPVIFGEVLFDRFPDGTSVLGGAPFNVAWHLKALGLGPLFVTRVGKDRLGGRILAAMEAWGMDTRGVQEDPDHPTGTVEVWVENGEPSYEIAMPSAWDLIDAEKLPAADDPGILYHQVGSCPRLLAPSQGGRQTWTRSGIQVCMAGQGTSIPASRR